MTAFYFQNGNSAKKKQNKKKQAKQSEPDAAKDDHLEKDSENTVQPIQNGHEGTVMLTIHSYNIISKVG